MSTYASQYSCDKDDLDEAINPFDKSKLNRLPGYTTPIV